MISLSNSLVKLLLKLEGGLVSRVDIEGTGSQSKFCGQLSVNPKKNNYSLLEPTFPTFT